MNGRKIFVIILFFLCLPLTLVPQSLSLAEFELSTTGHITETEKRANFVTEGTIALWFVPVNWLRFRAKAEFSIADTERFFNPEYSYKSPGEFVFDGLSLTVPVTGRWPVHFTVFTGNLEDPSSGTLLETFQKTSFEDSEFYDTPAGKAFSPPASIEGLGFAVTTVPFNSSAVLGLYGSWNIKTGQDAGYSVDLRVGNAGRYFSFNLFGGASFLMEDTTFLFRGGATALLKSNFNSELYMKTELRYFSSNDFDISRNIYLLFEPRVYWKHADLALSFFASPVFPDNVPVYAKIESESNYFGCNVKFSAGSANKYRIRGGINLLGSINPQEPAAISPFTFSVCPFYSMIISDFFLEFMVVINPLLLDDLWSAGEIRLHIKAVY
ncbi:hypothetical protein K7I13_02545 [Brucepastera parasyntrophica]|uniref:hypothetical protein n=1 Tax=Brucepastera parasyntrophica TaxID=2880008 RepID=UPI002108F6B1|nr:hypothetical protein [Brucepastera parasyntrophica]ULQ60214.1 hypothetical protein K7I13_02545 [Brucepastera parasyntrophica]